MLWCSRMMLLIDHGPQTDLELCQEIKVNTGLCYVEGNSCCVQSSKTPVRKLICCFRLIILYIMIGIKMVGLQYWLRHTDRQTSLLEYRWKQPFILLQQVLLNFRL